MDVNSYLRDVGSSSLTRDGMQGPTLGVQSLSHELPGKSPVFDY